jgi:predicted O-methyltransferase YrrM
MKVSILPRESQALRDLVDVIRPALIVEFGSWQGRSALTFLLEARQCGLQTKIICVDTWLGSFQNWQIMDPDSEWSFHQLKLRNGEPQILETFWQAIRDHDLTQETEIVRAPTRFAAPFLKRTGAEPDLVYVDADHSFGAVLEDLRLAESIVRTGGVIAGDDFSWQSVRLAVGRFARKGRTVMTSGDRTQFAVLDSNQNHIMDSFRHHGWKFERFIIPREIPFVLRHRLVKPLIKKVDVLYLALKIPDLKMRFRKRKLHS